MRQAGKTNVQSEKNEEQKFCAAYKLVKNFKYRYGTVLQRMFYLNHGENGNYKRSSEDPRQNSLVSTGS